MLHCRAILTWETSPGSTDWTSLSGRTGEINSLLQLCSDLVRFEPHTLDSGVHVLRKARNFLLAVHVMSINPCTCTNAIITLLYIVFSKLGVGLGMRLRPCWLTFTIMQVVWAELHPGPAAVGGVDLPPLPNGEVR